MTVVFAIPLVLLTVARWAYYTSWFSSIGRSSRDSDETAYLRIAMIAIALLSYVAYYVGYLISLIISRVREYYADQHAGELTEDPNALSTALVKIAYGLVAAGGYTEVKERDKSKVRGLRGLGIFDPGSAKTLAASSVGASGTFSKEAIQAAAAWDLFNPWAKYYHEIE
jgi:Zn-dependent protease with chaperone function